MSPFNVEKWVPSTPPSRRALGRAPTEWLCEGIICTLPFVPWLVAFRPELLTQVVCEDQNREFDHRVIREPLGLTGAEEPGVALLAGTRRSGRPVSRLGRGRCKTPCPFGEPLNPSTFRRNSDHMSNARKQRMVPHLAAPYLPSLRKRARLSVRLSDLPEHGPLASEPVFELAGVRILQVAEVCGV